MNINRGGTPTNRFLVANDTVNLSSRKGKLGINYKCTGLNT